MRPQKFRLVATTSLAKLQKHFSEKYRASKLKTCKKLFMSSLLQSGKIFTKKTKGASYKKVFIDRLVQ